MLRSLYVFIIQNYFGSPKERVLGQQIEDLKLNYSIANRELDVSLKDINSLEKSDEIRYRPILKLEGIPQIIRNPGFGGVDRFRDLRRLYELVPYAIDPRED